MEITLNIPQNKWSKPVEVRTEVVQAICNAFMILYARWHPILPYVNVKTGKFCESGDYYYGNNGDVVKFHETEMHAAFKALQEVGWFFIKHDACNGTWYELSEKNYVPDHQRRHRWIVTDFHEQWD